MASLSQTELAVIAFFIVIGPLIFFHELGHFVAARWNKIKVEEFGIGLPPRLATLFERGGTKFTLNALPLGGFVRPAGEDDPTVPGGLAGSPKRARLAVLAAGPGANVIVAFVLLVVMFMTGAPEEIPGARISQIAMGSPAAEAGLQPGDVVKAVDGLVIQHMDDLRPYIDQHRGQTILFTVTRGSETLKLSITPRANPPEGEGPTGIQIAPNTAIQHYGFFNAVGRTVTELGRIANQIVTLPVQLIRQQIAPDQMRYLRPVSVVGISEMGGQAIGSSIELNALWPIIQLTAGISLALALTNLLPIPALDGGRILFVLIEAVRGHRVDPQRETMVHFIGFALLLTAMLIFVFLDIVDPLVVRP